MYCIAKCKSGQRKKERNGEMMKETGETCKGTIHTADKILIIPLKQTPAERLKGTMKRGGQTQERRERTKNNHEKIWEMGVKEKKWQCVVASYKQQTE